MNIINEETARRAKESYSFSDYSSGSATAEYNSKCQEVRQIAETAKEKTDNTADHERIDKLVEIFERKYANWINRFNANTASVPSVMITGPSNFPVARKEKQFAVEGRLWEEYRHIMKIVERIEWNFSHIIKSNDITAVEQLQSKLDKLTADQERMKSINAYYRKAKTVKGYKNITDEEAEEIESDMKKYHPGQPFASYHLTNNNAKIKNTADRIKRLTNIKARPTAETKTEFFKVVENTEAMRLQLIFDGKPSEEIRSILKHNGFVWSPKNTAWQRQLTNNAIRSLRDVTDQIKKIIQ